MPKVFNFEKKKQQNNWNDYYSKLTKRGYRFSAKRFTLKDVNAF